MKKLFILLSIFIFIGCVPPPPPPQWNQVNESFEAEYTPYLKKGTATLIGQAFFTKANGDVVKAAGRTVTLDPATSIGHEWWIKSGIYWVYRMETPPSVGFAKARRITVADADGRFKFTDLPAGKYFVRTEVTWEIGGNYPMQGGLVGQLIEVRQGKTEEIILNHYPHLIKPPPAIVQKNSDTEKLKLGIAAVKVDLTTANLLQMKEPKGIIIVNVVQDSPAFKSGLKQGDVILKLGDKIINETSSLQSAIKETTSGSNIPITIWRPDHGEMVITVQFP